MYERLLSLGGFPEPLLSNDIFAAKVWRNERFNRVISDDIRDLYDVKKLSSIKLFVEALRKRCGQEIKLSNIARDLEVSPNTVKSWFGIIEEMYIGFPIYPYSTKGLIRMMVKQSKFYFFDNGDCINEEGKRLENLIATTLLKRLHFLEDRSGYQCQLCYIRDANGREVDFVTIIDGVIYELIEVKASDEKISSSLKYYKEKLKPRHTIQLVGNIKRTREKDGILSIHPIDYFTKEFWDYT